MIMMKMVIVIEHRGSSKNDQHFHYRVLCAKQALNNNIRLATEFIQGFLC